MCSKQKNQNLEGPNFVPINFPGFYEQPNSKAAALGGKITERSFAQNDLSSLNSIRKSNFCGGLKK